MRKPSRATRPSADAATVLGAILAAASARAQTSSLQEITGDLMRETSSPTTIYVAREVITLDGAKPRAQAVAVRDGRFVAVGAVSGGHRNGSGEL